MEHLYRSLYPSTCNQNWVNSTVVPMLNIITSKSEVPACESPIKQSCWFYCAWGQTACFTISSFSLFFNDYFKCPSLKFAENEGCILLTNEYNKVYRNIPVVISQGHFAKLSTSHSHSSAWDNESTGGEQWRHSHLEFITQQTQRHAPAWETSCLHSAWRTRHVK